MYKLVNIYKIIINFILLSIFILYLYVYIILSFVWFCPSVEELEERHEIARINKEREEIVAKYDKVIIINV